MESKEFIKDKNGASGFIHLALNIVFLVLCVVLTVNMVNNNVKEGYLALFIMLSAGWIAPNRIFLRTTPTNIRHMILFAIFKAPLKRTRFLVTLLRQRTLSLRAQIWM